MNRTRGFEVVSKKQFELDFKDCHLSRQIPSIEQIKLPERSTAKSAGYDVFSPIDFLLSPGEEIKVPTCLKAYMQNDEVLFVFPRSGHGFKYYTRLANTIGVVDSDYYNNDGNEGHIFVKIRNEGSKKLEVKKGDAFCQLIFQKYLLTDNDGFTGDERKGGIGSTGR